MPTYLVVLALAGLGFALGGIVQVGFLLNRTLRPIVEIKRYADDILEAGLGITRNLDGIDDAVTTRELATALPALAPPALEKLGVRL